MIVNRTKEVLLEMIKGEEAGRYRRDGQSSTGRNNGVALSWSSSHDSACDKPSLPSPRCSSLTPKPPLRQSSPRLFRRQSSLPLLPSCHLTLDVLLSSGLAASATFKNLWLHSLQRCTRRVASRRPLYTVGYARHTYVQAWVCVCAVCASGMRQRRDTRRRFRHLWPWFSLCRTLWSFLAGFNFRAV